MNISIKYIPSDHKFYYGYTTYLPNGKKIKGLQLDPFQEMA